MISLEKIQQEKCQHPFLRRPSPAPQFHPVLLIFQTPLLKFVELRYISSFACCSTKLLFCFNTGRLKKDSSLCFQTVQLFKVMTRQILKSSKIFKLANAPYCKEQLIYDVKRCPFTFKFDESTNRLVDNLYDGYVQYWSESEHKVLNRYSDPHFLRHCTRDDLFDQSAQAICSGK